MHDRPKPRRRVESPTFALLISFILSVSVYDGILVLLNEEFIAREEQNPVGRWFIALAGGSIWLFLAVKLLGTAVVGAALVTLFRHWRRGALLITAALALFQLGLLLYLSLA